MILKGHLCWTQARTEYAARRRPKGRYRLTGPFERMFSARSMIVAGKPEDHLDALEAGLQVQPFDEFTEIFLDIA